MCFSATASFIAGGVIAAVGVATLRKTEKKSEIPFASIPLLFGIQQILEGIIWLTFRYRTPDLNVAMTYTYSMFSHVLWPIFVPFSIVLLENISWRKKTILTFLVAGTAVSFYLLYFLIKFPITSKVVNMHIEYFSPHFHLYVIMGFYISATTISAMFSSNKLINIFGALALLSYIAAYIFYTVALLSVWCFFAAILSLIIYLYFKNKNIECNQGISSGIRT
jgi:hypothetical protein